MVVARDVERFAAGLQKLQHLTFTAQTVAEACDVIGSQGCTLALVEWAGCEPEGVNFCGELRERFPSLPVLLVVPSGHQERRRAALLVGVDAVLAEPVDELELAETVRSLLLLKNLRESRHRFRARAEADAWIRRVYGALGCGVLVLDAQGIVIECNEVAAGIYGAAAVSMVGRRIREFIKPLRADGSPLPEAERTLRRVLSTREPARRLESHFERADGERRWTLLDAIPLDDADGQVELIVCSLMDVTDAHRAQEAIRRSEGILQRAQHLARVGSFELDLRTKVAWWSDELYRIYGLNKEDILPTEHTAAFDRLVHPEDRWAIERREKALKEGATTSGEFRIIRPSGEVVFVSISAEVVRDEDGKPLVFTGALQDISDRKRSELELTRLRDHFERVVSHIRDALVVFDALGTIVYANKQFFALFGLPFGRPDQQVLGPLMPSGLFVPTAANDGEFELEQRVTYELSRADGSKLALEATITTVVQGRERIGKQVLFRDITERRLNERALHFLSNSLSGLTNANFFSGVVAELASLLGAETVLLGLLHGAPGSTIRPLGFIRRGSHDRPADFQLEGTVCQEVLSSGEALVPEGSRGRFPDCELLGQLEVEGCAGVALYDAQHQPMGVLAVMSSQQLLHPERTAALLRLFAVPVGAELGRRRGQARFEDFFEHSPDATLMVDENNQIRMANRQSCRLFGCAREQLLGTSLDRLLPPKVMPDTPAKRFRERSSGTTSKRMRADARRFDGSPFPAEVRFRPMPVQEGNWVVTTIRDLTDSLQAEERRRLLEAQLLQSQKMEAMGTLAGGIAHDFNNVLATIVVNLELARDSLNANTKCDAFLDEIGFATDHATQLVRRILAFSRQEETQKTLVPLQRPLEQAITLLRTLLPAGVELAVTLEPSSPKVFADVNQLQQVLVNLGTNAWHALDGKPGRITIIQDQVSVIASENPDQLRPGRYARLVVSDTGTGIDQRTMQRIFEPFFTTKPAGKGTGLGLAMVHGIMRDHDGNVTVESLPGEGATFTLLLPTVEGLTDSEHPSAPLVVPTPGQRILVVDGEPGLVRAASRFLGKLGYSVSGHHDAKEALVAFCSDPFDFDVLVADTALQGMNGLELARSMLELRPELPILLVTTQLDGGLREAARALGIREIMQKPYGLAELSDAILRTAARAAAR